MNKFQSMDELSTRVFRKTGKKWVSALLASATYSHRGFPGLLPMLTEGTGGWGGDPGGISFPDELAEEYGGVPEQYGYLEFEMDFPPDHRPPPIEKVPLSEAFELFLYASKHYSDNFPKQREAIEHGMAEAQKTFECLIARHEAWKRTYGENDQS